MLDLTPLRELVPELAEELRKVRPRERIARALRQASRHHRPADAGPLSCPVEQGEAGRARVRAVARMSRGRLVVVTGRPGVRPRAGSRTKRVFPGEGIMIEVIFARGNDSAQARHLSLQ